MFLTRGGRALREAEQKRDALAEENAVLRARLEAVEAERDALAGCVAAGEGERTTLDGVFRNLGTFGESLAGVGRSFLGLVTALNDDKRSAVEAAAHADASRLAFERIAGNLRLMVGKIGTASTNVEGLHRRATEIDRIVQLIREVADQTNLLALNAAIEAARAGEAGRGFAVVADEVRKLAERTGKATSEIGALVATIQGETEAARAVMQLGAQDVERFSHDSEEATLSMQHLIGLSRGVERSAAASALLANVELANIEELSLKLEVYKVFLGLSTLRPDALPDETACRLGQWYYDGEGKARYARLPGYAALEKPHRAVHEHARRALELHYAGEAAAALAALAAMEEANLEVMAGMAEMLAQPVGGALRARG
ncbi:chemotaxis protein [Azoarcus sp. DD4]|uniref:methyl-accepting chemotaxis protein n=1 Tax=Azoarcus sp. DD4 TaxID=2027405 RepID=UPI00112D6FD9|nr:methyl-accepting chemotaxis protein [Azoarcus sp. DD4]QDF98503.1 chemotaxis protein [Azoarcus sp. DD4]